ATAVVDGYVSQELDAPGLGVDLNDRDVGAEGVGGFSLVEVELGPQALLEVGRASSRVAGSHRQLGPPPRGGGAPGHADSFALARTAPALCLSPAPRPSNSPPAATAVYTETPIPSCFTSPRSRRCAWSRRSSSYPATRHASSRALT